MHTSFIKVKVGSEVVSDINELKPMSGQEHKHILLLCNINIAHIRQCFHEVLLYQVEVVLSVVEPEYWNLIDPICLHASSKFMQAARVCHGIHAPHPPRDYG